SNQTKIVVAAPETIAVLFGLILIRSVKKEVNQRERIEGLLQELGKSNDKLWTANEKLKELDRMKTEFVSMATHQLRSPLTAIKGYASMVLENSFGQIDDRVRGAVDIIFQSSQKLVRVIEDFLNITRIELGTMKYDQSEFNFKDLVESVGRELRVNVEKAGLQFLLEIDQAVDYKLTGDSGKLSQVVGNLIDNAIKYTPAQTTSGARGQIKIALNLVDQKIHLSVSDNGVGIPAEVIPKLFQKFIRADDAGKINITGTGLGLYVAKQIVEAHHGRIWVESAGAGQGSSFIVELSKK
ncbi:MAG: HAMP domain-containing sensor histidine kinase, partial [Patescibacteria group bacterium]